MEYYIHVFLTALVVILAFLLVAFVVCLFAFIVNKLVD